MGGGRGDEHIEQNQMRVRGDCDPEKGKRPMLICRQSDVRSGLDLRARGLPFPGAQARCSPEPEIAPFKLRLNDFGANSRRL